MATTAPLPIKTPPGAGMGIENALGAPPIGKPNTTKAEKNAKIPIGLETKSEKISLAAPPEDPTSILGLEDDTKKTPEATPPNDPAHIAEVNKNGPVLKAIENTPIPPNTPRDALRAVAGTADQPNTETTTTPTTRKTPEAPAEGTDATPQTETSEALEAKRQEIIAKLQELGKVLLEAGDTRASLAAIGLSAGDTPMGDEFRRGILETILTSGKPKNIEDARWIDMQRKSSATPHNESNLRKFFERHGFPLEHIDQWGGGEIAGAQQILGQTYQERGINKIKQKLTGEKGQLTPIAQDLQREMGWNEQNPMPTSHEALAKQFGDNPEFKTQMKSLLKTENIAKMSQKRTENFEKLKDSAPGGLHAFLIALSLIEGIVQQGASDSEGQQRH